MKETIERAIKTLANRCNNQTHSGDEIECLSQAVLNLSTCLVMLDGEPDEDKVDIVPEFSATHEPAYGRCPKCGAPGILRERRPNGNDICANRHKYPSATAIHARPTSKSL